MRKTINALYTKIGYLFKILSLKLKYGNAVDIKWSAKIAASTIIRINGNGRVIINDNVITREYVILNVSDGGIIYLDNNVFLNDGVCLNAREYIRIGEHTLFGQYVKVYDHDHNYKSENWTTEFVKTKLNIGSNVWIGAGSIILKSCSEIGSNSVIAAGTVVKGNVINNSLIFTRNICETRKF